jgi:hypothetical protein
MRAAGLRGLTPKRFFDDNRSGAFPNELPFHRVDPPRHLRRELPLRFSAIDL